MFIYVISFFIAWGLSRITHISTRNIITVVFFVLGYLLVKYNSDKTVVKGNKTIKCLAGVFSFLYLCGDFEGILDGLENKLFCIGILTVTGLGLFFLFYNLLKLFYCKASTFSLKENVNNKINSMSSVVFGILIFIGCFVFWTPYLLKNFPGIMTVDSINQYAQIIGIWEVTNHHPWIHTMIIKLFYNIGLFLTKDASYAIFFYTIIQMTFMAFCVAYFCVFLKRFRLSSVVYLLVIAFYYLIPYQGIYAISMIKDAPFGGCCLLYTLSIMTLMMERDDLNFKKNWPTFLLSFLSGVFFCLLRTNGFYAFLVVLPFVVVLFKKNWKLIVSLEVMTLAVVLIIKGPVMSSQNIAQPDLVENLSIPGQQISRVIMQNRELTKEQSDFLNTIMDVDRMPEGYTPYVSDWFKKLVRQKNQEYLSTHFDEFIKIYIQIGLKYPGDYLIAYRDQTIGYWFPCTDQVEIAANEGIIPNEFDIETKAICHGKIAVKLNEIALKLHTMIPGIGLLWSIGALFWIIIICFFETIFRGNKGYCFLYIPGIAIFLTLIISTPVAYDFRYAYGYVYCLPIYIILAFLENKNEIK